MNYIIDGNVSIAYSFGFWRHRIGYKERGHSGDQGIDRRMGSEWILRRLAGGCKVDPVGSG
jgi:hypothetical protein